MGRAGKADAATYLGDGERGGLQQIAGALEAQADAILDRRHAVGGDEAPPQPVFMQAEVPPEFFKRTGLIVGALLDAITIDGDRIRGSTRRPRRCPEC